MKTVRTLLLAQFILFCCCSPSKKQDAINLYSPDKKLEINVMVADSLNREICYTVSYNHTPVIVSSGVELTLKGQPVFKQNLKINAIHQQAVNETWQRVWGKRKQVINKYNEITVELQEIRKLKRKVNLIFRAYNDGVAFRYEIPSQELADSVLLADEKISYAFTGNPVIWGSKWNSFRIPQEVEFKKTKLDSILPGTVVGTPLLVNVADSIWLALMEANITDWAASGYTSEEGRKNTIISLPSRRLDDTTLIVRTSSQRFSPWKIIMVADHPARFIESDIVQNLNEPCAIEDTSWIKPGVSAWDWWWCNGYAPDAGFKLGSNTRTMKYFIDFASEMGWQYQLVDWHWYGVPFDTAWNWIRTCDITKMNPEIDIPGLVDYAASKNIRLFLWLEWHHADRQMEEAFTLYEKWGIAGVKIDFMDRNDQEMVNFYHRVAKTAARNHLLVDFHGAYMPDGYSRTYPNLITREGVLGNEYNKWSNRITPEHCLTLPYTRMLGGEMDFTPGGFVNTTREKFKTESLENPAPNVMGTRCFQLAMMVVYESALTVFCESPYNVRNQPGIEFLKGIPTSWDETKVLEGEIGDYIVIARKSGELWYVGGMSVHPRSVDVVMNFLDKRLYKALIWTDAPDAGENPKKLIQAQKMVEYNSNLRFEIAESGGFVTILQPR